MNRIVQTAIKAEGSKGALARKLGISWNRLHYWAKVGVPASQVLHFERVTGIPRERIKPELYKR